MKVLAGAALAAAVFSFSASAQDDDARYHALIAQLRCLVCQNQSIAESNAPLAADLRDQVRSQIAAGKSDAQIREFLTARYGDFVLYDPPFKARTWLLWLGPFAVVLLAAFAVFRFVRRAPAAPAPAPDAARVAQLLAEERAERRE